jgi:Holliday junction resolvase
MSKLSRQRGASYEREIAAEVFEVTGHKVRRNLNQYQVKDEGDLILGQFLIECKRRRKIAVYEWMEQAERSSNPSQTPVVVMRADGEKSLAVMRWPDLLKLLNGELPPQSQVESGAMPDS